MHPCSVLGVCPGPLCIKCSTQLCSPSTYHRFSAAACVERDPALRAALQTVEALGADGEVVQPQITAALPGFTGAEGMGEARDETTVTSEHVSGKHALVNEV